MSQDKASAIDYVEAGIDNAAVPPAFPCPSCGKESKDNNSFEDSVAGHKYRICAEASCRAEAEWTSGSGVLLNN